MRARQALWSGCGSALMGLLYDVSRLGLVVFSVAVQLAAIPFLLDVASRLRVRQELDSVG